MTFIILLIPLTFFCLGTAMMIYCIDKQQIIIAKDTVLNDLDTDSSEDEDFIEVEIDTLP